MPKLTSKVLTLMVQMVRAGLPLSRAAAGVGISPDTAYDWMAKGREAVEGTKPVYVRFYRAIEKAKTEHQAVCLDVVMKHARGHVEYARHPDTGELLLDGAGEPVIKQKIAPQWTAAAWQLERRYPDEYGQRVQVQQDVVVSHPLQQMAPERVAERLEVLRARFAEAAGRPKALPASAETPAVLDAEFKVTPGSNGNGNGNGHGH